MREKRGTTESGGRCLAASSHMEDGEEEEESSQVPQPTFQVRRGPCLEERYSADVWRNAKTNEEIVNARHRVIPSQITSITSSQVLSGNFRGLYSDFLCYFHTYLIIVTGTTGGARVKIFCHV